MSVHLCTLNLHEGWEQVGWLVWWIMRPSSRTLARLMKAERAYWYSTTNTARTLAFCILQDSHYEHRARTHTHTRLRIQSERAAKNRGAVDEGMPLKYSTGALCQVSTVESSAGMGVGVPSGPRTGRAYSSLMDEGERMGPCRKRTPPVDMQLRPQQAPIDESLVPTRVDSVPITMSFAPNRVVAAFYLTRTNQSTLPRDQSPQLE